MLRHLDEFEAASTIEHALLATLEQGVYTRDVRQDGSVGTDAFTQRILGNLGRRSETWKVRDYRPLVLHEFPADPVFVRAHNRRTAGVDIFVESPLSAPDLGPSLEAMCEPTPLRLKMISNRGTKVYPDTGGMTDCIDQWRCRFVLRDGTGDLDDRTLFDILGRVAMVHRWMHVEKLQEFDGALGYSRAQGED